LVVKSVQQGEALSEIKTGTTKRLDDLGVITTKRLDDLAEVILKFKKGYKNLEKRIKTESREVFLIEYYNNKQLYVTTHLRINANRDGTTEVFNFEDKQIARTIESSKNLFIMFGITASRTIDYKNFISINPDNKAEEVLEILEDGEYVLEINMIFDNVNLQFHHQYSPSLHIVRQHEKGIINYSISYKKDDSLHKYNDEFKKKFKKVDIIRFIAGNCKEWTIEAGSYVRFYLTN
jgi:hypothetical protein